MNKIFNSRRFRQGSVATAITVIAVALIVAVNMLLTVIADRYPLSLDLTENKIFGISDETKSFLSNLGKDVDVYILSTEENFTAGGDYFVQANEVIKKYAQQSSRVKINYVDLVRNPGFTSRFPNLQLNSSSIVVACGDKATDLTPYQLYNVETDPYYGTQQITSSKAEQAMTSAMLKVTSDKITRVSILTGHDETPLQGLRSLLEINNYEIVEQNLLTEQIDPDAKAAVINAPMRDLTDDELKKLDEFLNNGGKLGKSLYYFAANNQPDLPKLSAFLADWGIGVGDGVVFESSANRVLNMNLLMPVVDYTEEVYSKTVSERSLYTLVAYARPLSVLFEAKSGITVTSPLEFSATSGVIPPDADENWSPKETDITGPIPALIVAQNAAYEGTDRLLSNVVACGSSLAVEDSYLSATSIGNGEYFLNLINTLSEREDIVSIQSKTIGGNELGVQSQQIVVLGILLVIILPLAVLISGAVIWLRRRHR